MPYQSDAQRRWAHTPAGTKALGADTVKEFDQASKGKNLPERKGSAQPRDYHADAQRLMRLMMKS